MLSPWQLYAVLLLSSSSAAQISGFNTTTVATTTSYNRETGSNARGKVRFASTASGWEDDRTVVPPRETRVVEGDDVGKAIVSLIGDESRLSGETVVDIAHPTPSVHFEATEQGVNTIPVVTGPTEHVKHAIWLPTPVTNNGQTLTPIPATKIIIGGQTLPPGGATVTMGEGGATSIHLDEQGAPVVEVGGSTSMAQLSSASYQVFTIGDITGTAEAKDFHFVVAPSTLTLGQTVTVSGTTVALNTDAAGATVFIAGDSTATLAPLALWSHNSSIQTTVADGTTEYIIDSQTLAPGYPVTVHGTTVSLAYDGSKTMLVVGNVTSTINGVGTNSFTVTTGLSEATPGTWVNSGGAAATTSSKSDGAVRVAKWHVAASSVCTFGAAILCLG